MQTKFYMNDNFKVVIHTSCLLSDIWHRKTPKRSSVRFLVFRIIGGASSDLAALPLLVGCNEISIITLAPCMHSSPPHRRRSQLLDIILYHTLGVVGAHCREATSTQLNSTRPTTQQTNDLSFARILNRVLINV